MLVLLSNSLLLKEEIVQRSGFTRYLPIVAVATIFPNFKKKIWTLLIDFISHGIVWIVERYFSLYYKFGLFEVEIEVNCFHAFRKTVFCLPMLWSWSLKFHLKIMSFWYEWSPSSLSKFYLCLIQSFSSLRCLCVGGETN